VSYLNFETSFSGRNFIGDEHYSVARDIDDPTFTALKWVIAKIDQKTAATE
jgi:hypothetical protein